MASPFAEPAHRACGHGAYDWTKQLDGLASYVVTAFERWKYQPPTLTGMRRRAPCSAFNGRITLISCS